MIDTFYISDRDNIYDTQSASKDTSFFSYDKEGKEKFYPTLPSELVEKRNVLFLIHGYNNDKQNVLDAYKMIEKQVESKIDETFRYDMIIGYLWPGYEHKFDYFPAKSNAEILAPRLGLLLAKFAKLCQSIDVMAHSMGNRLFFESIRTVDFTTKIRHVFSLAAAIDNEKIEFKEIYYQKIIESMDQLYVFHSRNDKTLKLAYLAAEWDRALGYNGPENPHNISFNTTIFDATDYINNHGNYKESDRFFEIVNSLLQRQKISLNSR